MLTRWNDIDRMFGSMDLLRSRLDRLFSDYNRPVGLDWQTDTVPRTNLYDNGEGFEIRAEVPGFSKEDLNVKIQGNYLEISGSRKADIPEGYTVHRVERKVASFTRSFTLPADVDSSKVQASLTNGILTLTLHKAEAAKPRQITIN
ncbi:MAG: Hsp20/alpha crystallin family protein [Pseudomonadota bacterium]